MKVGLAEYDAALVEVQAMLPRGDAEHGELMMAADAQDIDIVEITEAFREQAVMEAVSLTPLMLALVAQPSEATVGAVRDWLAGRKMMAFAVGVRAGRRNPVTPFDEATDRMLR
jgi:hypothetical protein